MCSAAIRAAEKRSSAAVRHAARSSVSMALIACTHGVGVGAQISGPAALEQFRQRSPTKTQHRCSGRKCLDDHSERFVPT
jgi:hypothetical protein